ncbi:hypothetical protein SDC9_176469 [bioreactor metagenome]|uniref:Uncharacterized protein n=1 Tax=bioreactor metagenome TaxID=1076179 RepID=A0A645GQ34_9ZZZZ
MRNDVGFQQTILLFAEHQLAAMQKRNIVANLLQIADNVGRKENGMRLVPCEIVKDSQNLVAHHRIETTRRLVED